MQDQAPSNELNNTVTCWLNLHGLDVATVRVVLAELLQQKGSLARSQEKQTLELSAKNAWDLAAKALMVAVPDLFEQISSVRDCCETEFDAPETSSPYTLDRGEDQVPFVSLSYRKNPADALCIAHEFGHALQYYLTKRRFVPPVLRELVAFLSERAFVTYIESFDGALAGLLLETYQKQNARYYGSDAENLLAALKEPSAPYIYRLNYPVARFLANHLFEIQRPVQFSEIFRGKLSLRTCIDEALTGRRDER